MAAVAESIYSSSILNLVKHLTDKVTYGSIMHTVAEWPRFQFPGLCCKGTLRQGTTRRRGLIDIHDAPPETD